MQNNFDLKKFLIENKLTPTSQKNEGFRDMFSKYEPSETFQGDTIEEFNKWARSVFKKRGIPREDYEYWLSDVNGSPDDSWDGSYKGLSQDKLIGNELGAWFPEYRDDNYEGDKDDDRTLRPYDQMDEYFSFDNKSPEGQRIKNKPQDVLNRRGQGQITPDNKDIYKKVVGKKGDVGKAYGNVGPKGSLPENGSAFSKY